MPRIAPRADPDRTDDEAVWLTGGAFAASAAGAGAGAASAGGVPTNRLESGGCSQTNDLHCFSASRVIATMRCEADCFCLLGAKGSCEG